MAFSPDSARLTLIQPDGTEGGQVEIPTTEVAVGRAAGGFFATDPYLSPTHAIFRSTGKEVIVKDAGSLNGIFLKVKPNVPMDIRTGDIFRIGQELILFEAIDRGSAAPDGTERIGSPVTGLWGRLSLIVGRKRLGNAFPIGGDGVVLGRERGNILFPEDGYVSGIHMRLYTDKNKFLIMDLGSSNGSFTKIRGEVRVKAGDFLLMGQQLFRVDF
ncbi:MAG: FHA domain-containing protein [Deltaproteobacteria bacterium]|nr:FHA domain-containing protein [Deltaproteobacteria bacterium]